MTTDKVEFTRVNNDINGNPRYVCHFLALLNDNDEDQIKEDFRASLSLNPFRLLDFKYDLAISRAKRIGGKKFHNKQFGGGIVFQSYNIGDTERRIKELANE